MEDYFEDEDQEVNETLRVIQALGESLLKKRDEAVEFRAASGVERRWREDEALFDGLDSASGPNSMIDYATGDASPPDDNQQPKRSKVVVNIVRGKCETAEGRFADILLPVDDRNWGLKETPVPEIVESLKDDRQAAINGQPLTKEDKSPVTISDVAKMDQDKTHTAMKGMESEIDDQTNECNYNGEQRKLIRSAVRLGTGILKGPNVVKTTRKAWVPYENNGRVVHMLEVKEEHQPASNWVSCWNVYPDPDCGEDIKKASYVWEYETISPRDLRGLHGIDGYFDDQIEEILKEDPIRFSVGIDKKEKKHKIQSTTASRGSFFEKWEYYGDLSRDDLEALEIDLSHDTISQMFSACVVFVNDRPIKVCLNTLDTGDMPYDFFQWTSVTDSPWGIGVPRMMVWLQRIITAAWRAMMDNAGDSAGVNIVLGANIDPADGKWEITGKKIWRLLDDAEDVRKEFAQFQVQNNQVNLQAIIELALRFVDMETSLPMLFQGEKGEAPETLGATNIMVDSNNVALRGRVKMYDDQITRPHISRYYHWNMQYNPKAEIKGDFNVDVRGTSVLLQKDQQAQTLQQVMSAKADPDINRLVDWEKATKMLFKALGLKILKSEDDLKKYDKERQGKQAPQDPKIVGDKIRAESAVEEAKIKERMQGKELQFKAQESEKDRQNALILKSMERDIKMMELAEKRGMSLDQIKGKLTSDAMKLKTQTVLAGPDKKGPQVATPLVEPEGRAPEGMAFQR